MFGSTTLTGRSKARPSNSVAACLHSNRFRSTFAALAVATATVRRSAAAVLAVFMTAAMLVLATDAIADEPAKAGTLTTPATPAAAAVVELVIDYGDGVEKRFPRLAHRPGITVLELLQVAARHPRGVRFEHRGKGETAFVTQIDDLLNEGRGRNWTYRVNDKRADRSAGVYPLSPGDKVVWSFGG